MPKKTKRADVMAGPPAPVERNPAAFEWGCFMCGWHGDEPYSASDSDDKECPRCRATLGQPLSINTAPDEQFLYAKTILAQAPISPVEITVMLQEQGVPDSNIKEILKLLEESPDTVSEPEEPESPLGPLGPEGPESPAQPPTPTGPSTTKTLQPALRPNKPLNLALGMLKDWSADMSKRRIAVWDEPGNPLGPNYDPPSMAEAGEADSEGMPGQEIEGEGAEITIELAQDIGDTIGIDWDTVLFTVDAFMQGLETELEHGSFAPETNITDDCPITTGKIAWAHLLEDPNYYDKLEGMENN